MTFSFSAGRFLARTGATDTNRTNATARDNLKHRKLNFTRTRTFVAGEDDHQLSAY
ncbi:unnamed protein product [Rhodiola kirilowii]